MEGDPECDNLVAFSVYDMKTVHFLSMAYKDLTWRRVPRKVFDHQVEKVKCIEFLRTNVQEEYNYRMNSVDVSDQLRHNYDFSKFSRNYKWWFSIFQWAFGVLITNAYLLYRTTSLFTWSYLENEVKSHYEFRKEVALAWLDPNHYYPVNVNDKTMDGSTCGSKEESIVTRRRKYEIEDKRCPRVNDQSLDPQFGTLK